MNQALPFKRRALWGAAALALCCTLTSCGGDDSDAPAPAPAPTPPTPTPPTPPTPTPPTPTPTPSPGDPVAGESSVTLDAKRIEPLDTSKSAPAAKAQAAAQPALGRDAPVAEIVLPAPDTSKTTLEAPQKGQPLHIGKIEA